MSEQTVQPIDLHEQHVEALAIPETGRVLFVIHVDDEQLAEDGGEAVVADVWRLAQEAAGDRAHVAVLTSGLTLDVLTDEDLKPLGLQRIPAEKPRMLSTSDLHIDQHPAGWHM